MPGVLLANLGGQVYLLSSDFVGWQLPFSAEPRRNAVRMFLRVSLSQISRIVVTCEAINMQDDPVKSESSSTEKETKKKKGFFAQIWPNVATAEGRKEATNLGAFAAGWIAVSYLFVEIILITTGAGLFFDPADEAELLDRHIVNAILVVLATVFALRIWKKAGHISASIILIWTITEVGFKLVLAPGKGLILSALITVAAINGVRGTFATKEIRNKPGTPESTIRPG